MKDSIKEVSRANNLPKFLSKDLAIFIGTYTSGDCCTTLGQGAEIGLSSIVNYPSIHSCICAQCGHESLSLGHPHKMDNQFYRLLLIQHRVWHVLLQQGVDRK